MGIILDRNGAIDVAQAVDNFVDNTLTTCPSNRL